MFSDTSQSQKHTYCVTPLPRAVTFIEMERMVGARGTGVVVQWGQWRHISEV